MESLNFCVVDAFTNKPFCGNPAAVVILSKAQQSYPEKFLREFAKEMALSETAYTYEMTPGGKYSLRWFTPTVEIDLCGHATLATAHHLFSTGVKGDQGVITFSTRSGDLTAKQVEGGIELDFPTEIVTTDVIPSGLLESCGLAADQVKFFGKNRMDYMVVIEGGLKAIEGVTPDMTSLAKFPTRCVLVTSLATEEDIANGPGVFDFVTRVFAPAAGIPEDAVTGSAHCGLAPYWSEHLKTSCVKGYQASARGGYVTCTVVGDRVKLMGAAITVTRGHIDAAVVEIIKNM
eukprot:m.43308 g.43308  ORF g.43308 m.43308 type:complete len:290 (-) comp19341_c0_seq3:66-935(-)